MTTATRKKASPSERLAELEGVWAEARAAAHSAGKAHQEASQLSRSLHDRRAKLIQREPGLVDFNGKPLDESNEVGQVDKEIAKVPDLGELHGRLEHARLSEDAARREVEAFAAEHVDQLLAEVEPLAVEAAQAVNAAIAEVGQKLDNYTAVCQRLMGLAAAARRNTRVPALDQASGLARSMREMGVDVPRLG